MLGVISTVTLQVIAAYNLKETLWRKDFDSCMERHGGRIGASCISIARKTCRRSIRAFTISKQSAENWTRRAAS